MSLPSLHAVITGDIVNSTLLSPEGEKGLLEALRELLSPYPTEFYRGDSFQVYLKEPAAALRLALACRVLAIHRTPGEGDLPVSDIRISIGIGTVVLPVENPGMAKGEAFVRSGHQFDELQWSEKRLAISSGHDIADIGLDIMAAYLDSICKGMTTKQAEAVAGLLEEKTQQEIAQHLGKSKSTVSQLVSAARWPEIQRILVQFEKMVNQLV